MLEPDSAFHQLKSKLNFPSLFGKNQVVCSLCSCFPGSHCLQAGFSNWAVDTSLLEMCVKCRVFLRKWSDVSETVDISALAPAVTPITLQGGLAVLWPLRSLVFRADKCAKTKAAGTTVLFEQTFSNALWDPITLAHSCTGCLLPWWLVAVWVLRNTDKWQVL